MDCYGASIISDMQPRASSQGRIRYTPMKVFIPMVSGKDRAYKLRFYQRANASIS
ncbi:MAG: hypothetical protein VXX82_02720 [Verrucomicrobiota bacterium]|nr:hypothetical protein [Verrucomicrobiota bacterium]